MAKGKESKPHIGIFGRRNNGKSSLINMLAGQEVAIVSDIAGTTTDPVKKSIEISGLGPVIMVDTAGIDDAGELGSKRISRSHQILGNLDLAILLVSGNQWNEFEDDLVKRFVENDVVFFVLHNKSDIEAASPKFVQEISQKFQTEVIDFSTHNANTQQIDELVDIIRRLMPESALRIKSIVGDLISPADVVLLITPIDIAAPEGRLILPQVQVIRDILDHDGIAVVTKEHGVGEFIKRMNPKPVLVITDSQIFKSADAEVPEDIPFTSFSVLLARQKGDFENYLKGTPHLAKLKEGDRVLILESCTHHVSCEDIGRVKIPNWLNNFTGNKIEYEVVAGLSALPRNIREYAMVIQCGGCVITRKQVINRLKPAIDAGIPVTNYGMAIAFIQGIYDRAVAPFMKKHN